MPPFILSFQFSTLSFTALVTFPKSSTFVLNYDSFASAFLKLTTTQLFYCTVRHLKRFRNANHT